MSYAIPVKSVNRSNPKAESVRTGTTKYGLFTPKKKSRRIVPGNNNSHAITPATKDHDHRFTSKRREPLVRCARHQANGAFILVAATPTMIPSSGGPKPPPTRSMTTDNRIRARPPFLL